MSDNFEYKYNKYKTKYNQTKTNSDVKVHLFEDIISDYTSGCAIAIADSKENAIKILLKQYDKIIKEKKFAYFGTINHEYYTKQIFENELRNSIDIDDLSEDEIDTKIKEFEKSNDKSSISNVVKHSTHEITNFGYFNGGGS